jgi:hypothetical protein
MNSIYVRRADSMENFPVSSGNSPKPRKLILLSGDDSTQEDGEQSLYLPESLFANASPGSTRPVQQSGSFHLPSVPSINFSGGPLLWLAFSHSPQVFVSPFRPVDEGSPFIPVSFGPVFVTARAEKVFGENMVYLEEDERVVSWDLDGGNPQCNLAVRPTFFGLRLIVRSWGVDGEPAPGVRFTWQLLGEMRFVTKASESLTTENFPQPCAP